MPDYSERIHLIKREIKDLHRKKKMLEKNSEPVRSISLGTPKALNSEILKKKREIIALRKQRRDSFKENMEYRMESEGQGLKMGVYH